MPVFNERATVERAIASVLDADVGVPLELIVVDDGSTDGTRELLRAQHWPEQATLIEHDANRGKGAAVRTALARAGGSTRPYSMPTSSTTRPTWPR